jgi:hypothetical protein
MQREISSNENSQMALKGQDLHGDFKWSVCTRRKKSPGEVIKPAMGKVLSEESQKSQEK